MKLPFDFEKQYDQIKDIDVKNKYITHEHIVKINKLWKDPRVVYSEIMGKSAEGREIFRWTIGRGHKRILMWSQMHGDESTATQAGIDFFLWLADKNNKSEIKTNILSNTTIYFVPMLNPDGAERFTRNNALDLDINRDALKLQTPEGKILIDLLQNTSINFAFNLHNQSKYRASLDTLLPVTFSFLTPGTPSDMHNTKHATHAKRLLAYTIEQLKDLEGVTIGKFPADYDIRCFGETAQKLDIATTLIEAGYIAGDEENQELRKLHWYLFTLLFENIALKKWNDFSVTNYTNLPMSEKIYFDYIFRNVKIEHPLQDIIMDIAVNRVEILNKRKRGFDIKFEIQEFGDLSNSKGFKEIDGSKIIWRQQFPNPKIGTTLDIPEHFMKL